MSSLLETRSFILLSELGCVDLWLEAEAGAIAALIVGFAIGGKHDPTISSPRFVSSRRPIACFDDATSSLLMSTRTATTAVKLSRAHSRMLQAYMYNLFSRVVVRY